MAFFTPTGALFQCFPVGVWAFPWASGVSDYYVGLVRCVSTRFTIRFCVSVSVPVRVWCSPLCHRVRVCYVCAQIIL